MGTETRQCRLIQRMYLLSYAYLEDPVKKKGEPGVTAFLFFLLALADLDRREWPEKRRKGCSGISQLLDFWQRMWSEETQ